MTMRLRDIATTGLFSRCRLVSLSLCLFFLCAFAGNAFSQNLEALAEKIQIGNVEQKRDALLQIRNLETAEASRIAVPALRDASEIVRATAAFSVIFLPRDEAAQALIPLLGDKFELVRREVVYALGKVRDPSAIKSLVEILQKDKIMEVRNAAAIALGEIGDSGAVDALTQILQKKPADKEEFLRRSAARSIGQIAGSKKLPEAFRASVAVLIKTLQNQRESTDVKREAAFALGAIGDSSAVAVLRANLNSKDYYLAAICKEALKKISG